MSNNMTKQKYQECIDACSACAVECAKCAGELLNEKDIRTLARSIKLHQDCTALCFLAMEAMSGGSEYIKQITRLCAEISNDCADECAKNAHMGHCEMCTEVCRLCAVACEKISQMADK